MSLLYCICRSSDGKGYMIQCEKCDEWFHGHCVNITQTQGKKIDNYFCKTCIDKEPTLKITYFTLEKPKGKGGSSVKKTSTQRSGSSPSPSTSNPAETTETPHPPPIESKQQQQQRASVNQSSSSTESDREDDEDWDASNGSSRKRSDTDRARDSHKKGAKRGSLPPKSKGSGSKSPSKRPATKRQNSTGSVQHPNISKDPQILAIELDFPPALPVPSQSKDAEYDRSHHGPDNKKTSKVEKKRNSGSPGNNGMPYYQEEEGDHDYTGFNRRTVRQCLGPKCCSGAAPSSKYCSDECGRALAAKRLKEIMPKRLEQFGNPTYAATLQNQAEMEAIRKKLGDCVAVLEKLTARKTALEATIKRGKMTNPFDEKEDDEEAASLVDITCITCGQSVPLRTAIKHFERCFNRFENQTSYGSAFVTPTSSNIFCDTLNPKTMTYCKRLKVLCPEHLKETVDENEVCGFPLSGDSTGPSAHYCHMFKKNCSKHPSWERLKRAEIDLETLRTWIKMDELVEQERTLTLAIQSRGGIVQCMTNYTVENEVSAIA